MAFEASRVQVELGNALKRLRGDRTLVDVARDIGIDRRTLSRKEGAEVRITFEDVLTLCAHYEADGPTTARLSAMARASRSDQWWKDLEEYLEPSYYRQIGLENDAVRVRAHRPGVVHGLLQTEGYMQALFAGSGNFLDPFRKKANMRARLGRQRRLSEAGTPLILDVVMEDAALDKDFGRPDALLGQLLHLQHMAELPNVTIRTIEPTAPVVFEQLEVFEFGDLGGPAVTIVESIFGVVIVENELQVEQSLATIEHLNSYARSAERTAEIIVSKIKELEK